MPDPPSPLEQISSLLAQAQDRKHRQQYYAAMNAFQQAEALIVAQLPPELRDGASEPDGPKTDLFAPTMRAFFTAGAKLAIEAGMGDALLAARAGPSGVSDRRVSLLEDRETPRALLGRNAAIAEQLAKRGERLPAPPSSAPPGADFATLANLPRLPGGTPSVEHLASSMAAFLEAGAHAPDFRPLTDRLRPEDIPVELGRFYFADIPLGIGDCLVQLGQEYERALRYYARAENYPYTNPPFDTPDLWLRLAEAHLAQGDAAYQGGDVDRARTNYEMVLKDGEVPAQSRLYQASLAIMVAKVRFWLKRLGDDPAPLSPADFPPRHLAALATTAQRLAQLKAGLDFFGRPPEWVPVFSFGYLREVARGFAQFAAQANREYVAYTQRAEDQTQTVQQLEQAVALGEASIQVEIAQRNEVLAEIDAAASAERLAALRAQLARDNVASYETKGWDVMRLDEASAWASAAAVPADDEMRLTYRGLDRLGVSGVERPRSDLLHLLAYQRGVRAYELEVERLRNAAAELDRARTTAAAQTRVAQSRLPTADGALQVARWRNHFARVNLLQARTREASPELFFDLARLARETAQTYLRRAISVALAMEQAYNFENNTSLRRIRTDYGDLGGAGNLYAADFLLRDIDAFLYETVTYTSSKSQLVIRYLSLRREFPLQYLDFLRTGRMVFQTSLDQFHGDMPGTYNGRIKRVAVELAGVTANGGAVGSLACAGVSAVRAQDGTTRRKVHPAETKILSPLTPERAFARLDGTGPASPAGELAIFENVGLQCSWRLEFPLRSNDMQLSTAADVGLVVAYLCQHDPALELHDLANLPARGEAEFSFSLRDQGRDATGSPAFGQLEKRGEATVVVRESWLPRNLTAAAIRGVSVVCVRTSGDALPLTLRFWSERYGSQDTRFPPDPDAVTRVERDTAPGAFRDAPLAQAYRVALSAEDNPALAPAAAAGTVLDLSKVHDIVVVFAYQHGYR